MGAAAAIIFLVAIVAAAVFSVGVDASMTVNINVGGWGVLLQFLFTLIAAAAIVFSAGADT